MHEQSREKSMPGSVMPNEPDAPPGASYGLEPALPIDMDTYAWSVRAVDWLKKLIRLNIKVHGDPQNLEQGDIFVFNHFARVETFIPQWWLYKTFGAYCRSVAAAELFQAREALGDYLYSVGAVPTGLLGLVPFLAGEILRGRKIIVFPEGGMVKDRQILDERGHYAIYSRSARQRRKQHTGAARVLVHVELIKRNIRLALREQRDDRIAEWAGRLRMCRAELLNAAASPTRIVPANITFFPMRVGRNVLADVVKRFSDHLSRRAWEELLIEGNFLVKHTDMDIRLGAPLRYGKDTGVAARYLLDRLARRATDPGELLQAIQVPGLLQRWAIQTGAHRLRDAYMQRMYNAVTVNLSHLASRLILSWAEQGVKRLDGRQFRHALYAAIKAAQKIGAVRLHRGLEDPRGYADLPRAEPLALEQFMDSAARLGLVLRSAGDYVLQGSLQTEVSFDAVRVENPLRVYANEVGALRKLTTALDRLVSRNAPASEAHLAHLRFDDELRRHTWHRRLFDRPAYAEVNAQQPDWEDAAPFLLQPPRRRCRGAILLVHGFLSSPREVRGLGERLCKAGFVVFGLRLAGHGTSPWDLDERGTGDWLADLRRGYTIVSALAPSVAVVGFSTGAALAMALVAEQPGPVAALVCAAAPVRFVSGHMRLVPLLDRSSRIVQPFVGRQQARFRDHRPDHPDINYHHVPLAALAEVVRLGRELPELARHIECPCLLLQADQDPVVHPQSVQLLFGAIRSADKEMRILPAKRHGIVVEDLSGCNDKIVAFLTERMAAG